MLIEDCGWIWWLRCLVQKYNRKEFEKNDFKNFKDFKKYLSPFFKEIKIKDFKL